MHVSIVVPTLNRAPLLAECLQSIVKAVTGDSDVEIVVVDNGSTDTTASVCKEIAQRHPRICWRYFYDAMPGLLTGRHRGAKEARGEILAYLDDDVLLAPTWLDAIKDGFRDPDVVLVGGPCLPRYRIKPPSWLNGLWWELEGGRSCAPLSLIDLGPTKKPVDPLLVWGLNFSIRRQVLRECGGFHPDCLPSALQRYQGDGETGLSIAIKEKALGSIYHPGAGVEHIIPASRLMPEAFEARGFYMGVCNSYTEIRRERSVKPAKARSWKDPFRGPKRSLHRTLLFRRGDGKAIRELMKRAISLGSEFHRREVRNNPQLLEWVLRPDYFEYALPQGWQRFASVTQ